MALAMLSHNLGMQQPRQPSGQQRCLTALKTAPGIPASEEGVPLQCLPSTERLAI
jgi:hypothetical protein